MKKKTQPHHDQNRNHNNNNRSNNNNTVFAVSKGLILCRNLHFGSHLLPFVSGLIGCFLFLLALVSFLSPPINHHRVHRVRYNHSMHPIHQLDQEEINFRSHIGNTSTFLVPRGGGNLEDGIWTSNADVKTNPDRFLMIITSGGLNQQRTGITDAVVAAYILNSTLVVPKLDSRSYWKDQSNFSDIFDVDWFISYLSKDVNIVKKLSMIDGKFFNPYRTRVPRKCDLECYESRVLPLLEKKKVVLLTKYDYRLSNNLDMDLPKLRCPANYHALRYTDPIREMGKRLVERMRMKSDRYIALHLR
ncbi:putative GDP-fucose protein O-fucosyltransferase [Helianthus debilis subsp. tardiflorus]